MQTMQYFRAISDPLPPEVVRVMHPRQVPK